MKSIKQQLVANSFSNIVQIIAALISGIILPPILISYLGFKIYGIWGLIILLNQYSSLLDLGFQTGFIKISSEYLAKGLDDEVNYLFTANLLIYIILIIVIVPILILFYEPIFQMFFGDSIEYKDLYIIALIYSLTTVLNLITIPFSSLLRGFQRYDISTFVDIAFLVVNSILSIIFVLMDFGLYGLVYSFCIASIVKLFASLILSKKIFIGLRIQKISIKLFEHLRQLFVYTPAELSIKIFSAVTQTLIRFTLKNFAGIEYVGIYDIAKRLVGQVLGFSSSVFVPFIPAMSSLSTQKMHGEISEILKKATLLLCLFSIPILFYLLFFFEPILKLWLNLEDVSILSYTASILLFAMLFDLLTGPITTSSIGFGIIRLHIYKLTLTGITLAILILILGTLLGYQGIIISESIANLVGLIFSVLFFDRLFNYNYSNILLRSVFNIFSVAFPIILFTYIVWILFREYLQNHFIIFAVISFTSSVTLIFWVLMKREIILKSDLIKLKSIFKPIISKS